MPAWPLQSTSQPALYCPLHFSHLPLPCKRTHQNIQGGLLTCSREKQNFTFTEGILLQQPKLPAAAPGFTCGSLTMLKKSPVPPHLLRRHPHHSQDKKPSSAWVEDEPGKATAKELHPPMPQPNQLRLRPLQWMGSPPAARALGVLCPGAIPQEPWHNFTWPFAFTGIWGGTAVLSVRKGRMIKPAKQLSKRVIPSSAPSWALSTELLFRNVTKRKSESYFGCVAEKLPPLQRN